MQINPKTIADAVQAFLCHQQTRERSNGTIDNYKGRIKYFRAYLKDKQITDLREITNQHIQHYHDSLIKRNLSTITRIGYLSTIQTFMRWAFEHRLIFTDIADRMELPEKEAVLPPNPLTLNQVTELLESIPTYSITGKRNKAILEIMYGAGLRQGEVIKLRVGDLDFVENTIFIHGKGAKDRLIPIHDTALKAVNDFLAVRDGKPKKSSPLFLTRNNKGIEGCNIDQIFKKLNKKLRFHVHPHLLRHTFAVHLLKNGVDIRFVQALLGHEDPSTTGRYLGLVKSDLKKIYDEAMERILCE